MPRKAESGAFDAPNPDGELFHFHSPKNSALHGVISDGAVLLGWPPCTYTAERERERVKDGERERTHVV